MDLHCRIIKTAKPTMKSRLPKFVEHRRKDLKKKRLAKRVGRTLNDGDLGGPKLLWWRKQRALHDRVVGGATARVSQELPKHVKEEIEMLKAVGKRVGDKMKIMYDAGCHFNTLADALEVGKVCDEYNFYWYEDPLHFDDIIGYMKLKQVLKIPIAATELPPTGPTAYAPWILQQATDYLRGDPVIKGGLTSCLKTAHTAETFNMNYEVHHGGNSLTNVANLHLIMAIRNCEYFEVLLPDEVQKHGLVIDIEVDRDGMVHAPQEPGLGMEIDFEMINRNRVVEL